MTDTTAAQRVTLPDAVMSAIRTVAADKELAPAVRLTGVLMLIHGWAAFDRQEQIDPSAIALPETQWNEVCQVMIDSEDPTGRVNLGLSFMNSGPTSYKR